MRTGIRDRTTALNKAYSDYVADIKDATDRLGKVEDENVSSTTNYVSQSAYTNYNSTMAEAYRDLQVRVSQAWDTYQRKRADCSGAALVAPASYGGGYMYPTNYYNNYYQYPYYQPNYPYQNYPHYYDNRSMCTPPNLSPLPAGYGYECSVDSNGCQRCRAVYLDVSPRYTDSCECPTNYAPVCTTDYRNYDNACQAVCRGGTVWHTGRC